MTEQLTQTWARCRAALALVITLAWMATGTVIVSSQSSQVTAARAPSRDVSAATPVVGSGTIRGRVVDTADGHPLRSVRIQAPSHSNVSDVFTDDDGRFTFETLEAGTYSLVAVKAGYVTTWRRIRSPSEYQVAGPPIEVAAGQTVEHADFALTKGGVIAGRVMDDRGREVIGAAVRVYRSRWSDGQPEMQRTNIVADRTDDLGEFRLFGLAAGSYLLGVEVVRPMADGQTTVYYPASLSSDEAQPLTVRPGEELAASITLPVVSTSSIVGSVRGEDGQPQGGIAVVARRVGLPNLDGLETRSTPDGSYRLSSLLPGEYEIAALASSPSLAFAVTRVIVDGRDISLPLTLGTGGTIRGRYRFDTGPPPPDVKPPSPSAFLPLRGGVQSVVLPHNDNNRLTIDESWRFTITGLDGTYRFTPNRPAGWFVKRITLAGRDVTYEPLDITGGTVDDVEILLTQKTTHLSVSLDGTDAEVDDATILIFAVDESKRWPRTPFMTYVRIAQGRSNIGNREWRDKRSLTLSGLPPARYYAIAVAQLEFGRETSPELLRQLAPLASAVELVEDATRSVALKVIPVP